MAIPKSEWIWHNGQFVKWDEANVHVTAHALHYGSSVFEGIRAYATPNGAAILGLDPHVRRLFESCHIMRMDLSYSQEEICATITEIVRRNKQESCYIRPLVYKGSGTIALDPRNSPTEMVIFTLEFGTLLGEAVEQGADVMVSSWRRMAPSTLAVMSKTGGNYINSQFVSIEAKDHGFAEGIALDVNGFVSEGSGENIFVVRRGKIYTPPVSASILMGVTRDYMITLARDMGHKVVEETFPREMLYVADEIFFTGTAVEVTPVRSVDNIQIGSGTRGPITKKLQDEFFGITSGQMPDRYGWMTVVK
jgi:branched-chain amino acid aminotransferase